MPRRIAVRTRHRQLMKDSTNPPESRQPKDGLSFIHSSLDDYGLSPSEFRIYCHVNRRAGRPGKCSESLKNIAEHCQYCPDITRDALRRLTSLKILRLNYIKGHGNEYRLNPPREWAPVAIDLPLGKNTRGIKSEGGPRKKSEGDPLEKVLPKGIPREGIPYEGIPNDGFEIFWKVYPRKVAKAKAHEIWARLKPTAELQTAILKSIDAQSKSDQWRKDGGKFIPYPTTWLHGNRWEDELTVTTKPIVGGNF
jgi:hypothetical protein